MNHLAQLQDQILHCRSCPRLVEHRERIAREKRRAYLDWDYWGKPVPSLGKADARLLLLGLAPAAHGANRTGRMFTGDRSGDFLYPALFRFGFCNQSLSRDRDDGLQLQDTYITAAIHCAPPANNPNTEELALCRDYLKRELKLLSQVRVTIALGKIAWQAYLTARKEMGWALPRPLPDFSHASMCRLDNMTTLIASYHPSQRNTQTGRLTHQMFDQVLRIARSFLAPQA